MPTIRLEPLAERHVPALEEMLADGDALRFTRVPEPVPPNFGQTWLDRYEDGRRDGSREAFAIVDAADEGFLGLALAPRIDRAERTAELGYVVAPAARGRGVATEALRMLTEWGFAELDALRVELWIDVVNEASKRVAERCGYVREGVLRSVYFKQGRRHDFEIWSRVPTDPWQRYRGRVADDRRNGLSVTGPVALVALAGALTGIGWAAAPRPDLVEASVVLSQSTVHGGARLRVTDVVVDRGAGAAPRTATGFYLSRDRKRSRGDVRLGRRAVGRLGSGARSRRTTSLRVPLAAAGRSYRVLACADDRRRVRETREANNCRAAARAIRVTAPGDQAPPTFAGLESATRCIPGPIGPSRTAPYRLAWSAASDDVSPSSAIVYDVYQATRSGGEDFSAATYTTAAGATTFTTPPLSSTETYYFVVRARDAAGNRDSNKIERMGVNPCV